MSIRIAKVATPDIEKQRVEIAGRYQQAADDLSGIIVETPRIVFEGDMPTIDEEKAAERIAELASHLPAGSRRR